MGIQDFYTLHHVSKEMQRKMSDFSIHGLPVKCALEHHLNRPNIFSDFSFDAHFKENENLTISIRFTPQTITNANIEVKPNISSLLKICEAHANDTGPKSWTAASLHACYSRHPFHTRFRMFPMQIERKDAAWVLS